MYKMRTVIKCNKLGTIIIHVYKQIMETERVSRRSVLIYKNIFWLLFAGCSMLLLIYSVSTGDWLSEKQTEKIGIVSFDYHSSKIVNYSRMQKLKERRRFYKVLTYTVSSRSTTSTAVATNTIFRTTTTTPFDTTPNTTTTFVKPTITTTDTTAAANNSTRLYGLFQKIIPPEPQMTQPKSDSSNTAYDTIQNNTVNCSKLYAYDKTEIARVGKMVKEGKFRPVPDGRYIFKETDCGEFITTNGFNMVALSEEERHYPIAFGLRMHKDVSQVVQLLRTIYMPQNVYCVHVDRRAQLTVQKAMKSIVNCFSNVFLVPQPESFEYSGFSPVSVDLKCMSHLLNKTYVPWKYFLNIAGQEFPLKTNLELVRILKFYNGTNDIESYLFPNAYKPRVEFKHKFVNGRMESTSKQKEPFLQANLTLYKGSSYNMFSRGFVTWVLNDPVAQSFINWTRDLDSPDEVVWATLNHLPEAPGGYPTEVVQQAKTHISREVKWQDTHKYCHSHRYVHGVCILSCGDLKWLTRRWEIIANKFDIHVDHYVLDCLEKWLRDKMAEADPDKHLSWYWLKGLPHIRFNKYVRQRLPTWPHDYVFVFQSMTGAKQGYFGPGPL